MKRNLLATIMLCFFLLPLSIMNAQVGNTGNQSGRSQNKQSGMGMSGSLQNCMDQIAADSTSRGQMMSKMMDSMKGDSAGMRQMCKKFMDNPDMRKMMMKMMDRSGMGSRMQGMGSGSREGSGMDKNGSGKDLMKGAGHIIDTVKVMP